MQNDDLITRMHHVPSNVDACGDLAYVAGKWNSVSQSSWDLTESSTQSGSISIWTQDLGSSTLGKVYHDPGLTGPTYTTDTYIKFSDHLDFGDIGSGDSSSYALFPNYEFLPNSVIVKNI